MPLLTRRSYLTYSEETTYGTASSGTYKALEVVRDPDIAPLVVDRLPRDTVRPWHGNDRQRLINRRVTVSFQIQLSGSGTAGTAPQFGDFLVSCAMTETVVGASPGPASVTYALASLSGTLKSVTLRWYQDGTLHQVAGCRATWTISGAAGEFVFLNIEATGIYSQPTDTALPTAVFANQAPPLEMSATNTPTATINSVANCVASFELNVGNSVVYESYAGCTTQLAIRDRVPEGTIELESKLIAGQNFYTLFEAGTLVPISIVHGITAGNILTMAMSNCQLMEPTLADRNGVQFMSIPFMPISTDGTSEISLAFT
jgi:hypothetical protein